jgi:3-oxoacyl-[acyl-carrier protein] reductase
MQLLEGKVALITGASQGIGRAIAEEFQKQGAHIAFTYVAKEDITEQLENEMKKDGLKVKGWLSDASNFEETQKVVTEVIEHFGKIDILVNNAGITQDNLLLRLTEENWDNVIRINLKSCFNFVKATAREFMKQRSGSIINMSSVVGVKGNAGQSNYSASKAGMIGFTKSIALELGSRNVRCNAIAPGFIETEMTQKLDEKVVEGWKEAIPLRRGGTPTDVAKACVFLASDLSDYITGQVLQVDGGMLT